MLKLSAVIPGKADAGHKKATASFGIDGVRQKWQWNDRQTKQFDPGAFIYNALFAGVVNDLYGFYFPARSFWTAVRADNFARRICRIIKRINAIFPPTAFGGKPAFVRQNDQQIVDDAVFQGLGEFNLVTICNVAFWADCADGAFSENPPAFAVPDNIVGAHRIAFAADNHIAFGGDDFCVGVIFNNNSIEIDLVAGLL